MKKVFFLFASITLVFFLFNCGGGSSSQTNIDNVPEWYLNPPNDPNYLFGKATSQSKDMQLAIDKAALDGRADIGRQVELKLQGLQKKFDEEVGVGENSTLLQQFTQATKSVMSTVLSGSQIIKNPIFEEDGLYKAYVLVQYPVGAANEAFMDQIKKREELYTRFRSSQAFDELEKEVQKYEEWKEK